MNSNFLITSALLGVGLAMDAFSVSMANGLHEPKMSNQKELLVSGTYAFFQFIMPILGWFCVHNIAERFQKIQPIIPWVSLLLLLYIGGNLLREGFSHDAEEEAVKTRLGIHALLLQGIATSIDALSVGFTISAYSGGMALLSSLIIAIVTWILCFLGIRIGKKFGMLLSDRASILGGVILIGIGFKIFFGI